MVILLPDHLHKQTGARPWETDHISIILFGLLLHGDLADVHLLLHSQVEHHLQKQRKRNCVKQVEGNWLN